MVNVDYWKERFSTACNRGIATSTGLKEFHDKWFDTVKPGLEDNLCNLSDLKEYVANLGELLSTSRIIYLSGKKEILICEDGTVYVDITAMAEPPKSYISLGSTINSVYCILFFANQFLDSTNKRDIQVCGDKAYEALISLWNKYYPITEQSFLGKPYYEDKWLKEVTIPMLTTVNLVH